MTTQPEALSLAEVFEEYAVDHQPDGWPAIRQETLNSAAAELRRLHAENEALRAALYPSANQKIEVLMTSERQELEALFAIGEQSAAELSAEHKPVCTVIDESLSEGTARVRFSPEFRGRLRYGTKLYAALEKFTALVEARAAAAEREACAQICEFNSANHPACGKPMSTEELASAIRARGEA